MYLYFSLFTSHTHTFMLQADLGISDVEDKTALHYSVLQRKLACARVIVDTVVS